MQGIRQLAPISDVVVIVDVLSFSTAVDIAVSRGAEVLPFPWNGNSAEEFAASKGAVLASPRSARDGYSLSPASLESIEPGVALVLPSPNGATLSLNAESAVTFTACLRNCAAVAARILEYGSRIAVIPAGEGWGDGSLRPAIEDWIGAGAVLSCLTGRRSPEADIAVTCFENFEHRLADMLTRSCSGKELAERGFLRDVELAAGYNCSSAVPILRSDRFTNCGDSQQ
ncbi:MAG TPA: 2-phosphosulfolactate phosphatase [Bryobacteraceae bacterium]|nr:2-phosphosulfolactate phosphatase [Bryobacteraceae bacterium]